MCDGALAQSFRQNIVRFAHHPRKAKCGMRHLCFFWRAASFFAAGSHTFRRRRKKKKKSPYVRSGQNPGPFPRGRFAAGDFFSGVPGFRYVLIFGRFISACWLVLSDSINSSEPLGVYPSTTNGLLDKTPSVSGVIVSPSPRPGPRYGCFHFYMTGVYRVRFRIHPSFVLLVDFNRSLLTYTGTRMYPSMYVLYNAYLWYLVLYFCKTLK